MAINALTIIKNELYIINSVKNFHSMLVLIKQVLIIVKLMYLINMKFLLLKRCYICTVLCYNFDTILFIFLKRYIFISEFHYQRSIK